MKFIHRLAFYLGGFIIGLILLFFFLSGKKTSCDYGPTSRTLKNIRLKPRYFSENVLASFSENKLDTSIVSELLKNGDVIFSESNTSLDSCKQYVIAGAFSEKEVKITVENCTLKAKIIQLQVTN